MTYLEFLFRSRTLEENACLQNDLFSCSLDLDSGVCNKV